MFQPLEPVDVETVLGAATLRQKYVDALMFMHDLLCEFSSTQGQPRLAHERAEAEIEGILGELSAETKPGIVRNLERNYEYVARLRDYAKDPARTMAERFAVDQMATEFLESLVQAYRMIRTSRLGPGS